ncbi:vWA domain-containing protein [Mycolicibacterium thermoresistibile]
MTFQPALPVVLLLVIAAALVALRAMTLRPALAAGRTSVWRWCGVTVAMTLLLIAAVRPALLTDDDDTGVIAGGADTNVFLVVDRSADSAVEDHGDGASRMAGIRDDITALTERYPRARFAVLSFAARPAVEWPLSADVWSLQPVANRLAPYDSDPTQVNAAAAATVLRYQLIAAAQQYPDSQNLVFYFGSGAGRSVAPQGEFDLPPGAVDGGAVYGYGNPDGTPGAAQAAGSPLNEAALQRIAEQLGVPYLHRTAERPLPQPSTTDTAEAGSTSGELTARIELYWVLTMIAAALLLAEIFVSLRDLRRARLARQEVQS